MALILEVPPEVEAQLREAARQRGTDVSRYISEVILRSAEHEIAPAELTLDETAQMLKTSVALVTRMLERGDLTSLSPGVVLAEKRRREAASRAMDEIVAISEDFNLYDHQRDVS